MLSRDAATAKQVLSLAEAVFDVTDNMIITAFSTEQRGFPVGGPKKLDKVNVFGKGSEFQVATIRLVGKTGTIYFKSGETAHASKVYAVGAVRCTQYQVTDDKAHGTITFPGAKVAAVLNAHCGVSPDRAEFVSKFLRDGTVVEPVEMSLANASKGVKYRLKANRWSLWHRLVDEMKGAKLMPVSWGYFWALTGTGQYELQTADNCCCGTCRTLGFDNYTELREIVEGLHVTLLHASNNVTGLPTRASLLKRINKEEEFRKGLFLTHLKAEDSCSSHCRTMLLSSHNDARFCKPCAHGCVDDGPAPETFTAFVKRTTGRKANKDDWNDVCLVRKDEEAKGNVLKCTHCNLVAHPSCVERAHWDVDKTKDWTCWQCVRDIDKMQHTSSCSECNEAHYLIGDIKLGIDLLIAWEAKGVGGGAAAAAVTAAPTAATTTKTMAAVAAVPNRSSKRRRAARSSSNDGSSSDDSSVGGDSSSSSEEEEEEEGDDTPTPTSVATSNGRISSSGGGGGGGGGSNSSGGSGGGGSRPATASELLVARLELADGYQLDYHAHLIRDNNQACFKGLVMDTLPLDSFYLLVDYWANVGIAQAGGTACCEGSTMGLSAHGSMFVYRNPSLAERAEISKESPDVDWKKFGAASDEAGGKTYLEEHFNVYCDDAKQNSFHTKSVMEATIKAFVKRRPWLKTGRNAFVQSDNAANYRSPTTEIDLLVVGTRCFSEAGMGKDEGDANGAVVKTGIKRKRDAKNGVESAGDLMTLGNELQVPGQTHAVLKLERGNEDGGIEGRGAVNRNYGLWAVNGVAITYWESLDVVASKLSIAATGRAVGFGPGVIVTIADFNAKQRTQLLETGGALEFAGGEGGTDPNPRPRASHEDKQAAKRKASDAKAASSAAIQEKAAAAQAAAEVGYCCDTNECADCGRHFLTDGWFNRHQRFCVPRPSRAQRAAERRQRRHVPTMLLAADALAVAERKVRIAELGTVRVALHSSFAAPLGLDMEQQGDSFVVSSVSGLALATAQVSVGFEVVGVCFGIGEDMRLPEGPGELSTVLGAGRTVEVELRRPEPPIPYHGAARKGIHKQTRVKMASGQLAWLEANVFYGGVARMHAKPALEAMKAAFAEQIRIDTMTPMWLSKDQISTWRAAQVKDEKNKRRLGRKASKDGEAGGAVGVPSAGAAPAPPPSKKTKTTKITTSTGR